MTHHVPAELQNYVRQSIIPQLPFLHGQFDALYQS